MVARLLAPRARRAAPAGGGRAGPRAAPLSSPPLGPRAPGPSRLLVSRGSALPAVGRREPRRADARRARRWRGGDDRRGRALAFVAGADPRLAVETGAPAAFDPL